VVVSSFSCFGISTGDLNPVYNVPMLGTHKPLVASGDNVLLFDPSFLSAAATAITLCQR
jgi:hypothetical protein